MKNIPKPRKIPKVTAPETTEEDQCEAVANLTKILFLAFISKGFNTEQAFILTKCYIDQGLIDYL